MADETKAGLEMEEEVVQCRVCGGIFRILHPNHIKKHLMTPAEYKKRYGVAFLASKQCRRKSANNRVGEGARPYVPRDRDEILRDLRGLPALGRGLSYTHARQLDRRLVSQAERAFGSWRKALDMAGIQGVRPHSWSRERILKAVSERLSKGKPLHAAVLRRDDLQLYAAGIRYFGSWRNTLEAVGLDYRQISKVRAWDKEGISKILFQWCAQHGPLNPSALNKTDSNLYQAIRKYFQSVEQCARSLGLPYAAQRRKWTRQKVADELRAWHCRHGPLSEKMLYDHETALYMATRRYFGSLRAAAGELELPLRPLRGRSEGRLA